MTTYKVQMMTPADYNNYMTGGYNYSIKEVFIQATTKEEAGTIAKADYPNMVSNGYIASIAEIEAEKEAKAKALAEAAKKADERKARNEEAKKRKIERDLAQGITPEKRKAMTYAKRYQAQIDKLQAEMNELIAKRDYWNKKAQGE